MKNTRVYIALLFVFSVHFTLHAQANDDCDNATKLTDLFSWCSNIGQFSNIGATASPEGSPVCFVGGNDGDLWFTFRAEATDVSITIRGNTDVQSGGSLRNPEIAFYDNSCGNLTLRKCATDRTNSNITELYHGGLVPGNTYTFRVRGRNNNRGTFQLCINNYNPPQAPGSDCINSSVLCDKSTFTIQEVIGAGNTGNEAANTCLGETGLSESNSTWFTWAAKNSGNLTFVISPTNPTDDIDFAIFELPSGVKNCKDKTKRLCMAAGDFKFPSTCMGPTGLRSGESDTDESPGCDRGQNNWVRPLDMEAGKSYALLINNYTSSGNGFTIEFGGTAEFVGPESDFNINKTSVCIGEDVTFTDISTDPTNSIEKWSWTFGADASIANSKTKGPHTIQYSTPGEKLITLVIENSKGCRVTVVKRIVVDACCETLNKLQVSATRNNTQCNDSEDGNISLQVISNLPPVQYLWDNGSTSANLRNVGIGTYQVTISDQYCDTIMQFQVLGPPPLDVDTIMTLATCSGGQDGALELRVTGGTPPYLYNWNDGRGFQVQNKRSNLAVGSYQVTIQDANFCETPLTLQVKELELILDPTVQAVTPPTCFGFNNGSIVLNIFNGRPPFQFNWNDGLGFVDENSLQNIASGNFVIDVIDANLCRGQFNLSVTPPPPLALALDSIDVTCFGGNDGETSVIASGGVGGYTYSWNDPQAQNTAIASQLIAGNYFVTVLDANRCVIVDNIIVNQPPELRITDIQVQNVVCNGDETGSLLVRATGGVPPFRYSINNKDYQDYSLLSNLKAGTYTVFVKDSHDCITTQTANIQQPAPLIVTLEKDTTIELGNTFTLMPTVLPVGRPVTYEWSEEVPEDCRTCENPLVLPIKNTSYTVTVTDETNCTAKATMLVRVLKVRPVFIPNAFTPDGDENNDYFSVFGGAAVKQIQVMRVYNRWGGLVYEGKNLPVNDNIQGWDGFFQGKKLPPGVFAYYLEVAFIDGEILTYTGDITILN